MEPSFLHSTECSVGGDYRPPKGRIGLTACGRMAIKWPNRQRAAHSLPRTVADVLKNHVLLEGGAGRDSCARRRAVDSRWEKHVGTGELNCGRPVELKASVNRTEVGLWIRISTLSSHGTPAASRSGNP